MGKIDSLEEQRLVQVFGQGIGEAIAEVESGFVTSFAEIAVSLTRDLRLLWRDPCAAPRSSPVS